MIRLIDSTGSPRYGIIDSPVEEINFKDFPLETPMGMGVPGFLKKIIFNQFAFFGITGPDFIIGMAVVDLKYLANAFFYVFDRKKNKIIETSTISPPIGSDVFIRPTPDKVSCGFLSKKISISMEPGTISAKSKDAEVNLAYDASRTAPLRICSRAGYRGWVYTQKTTPIHLTGEIILNGNKAKLASPDCMGLIDWTAGYMRRETFWNWAASASVLPDGRTFGMNLSCGVNETSFTENGFWIDGKLTKVSTVYFEFNPKNFYDPWRITSADGKVNLMFESEQHRSENVNALVIATRFTQMMGVFNGELKTDDNKIIKIENRPGWAEDHYAKW
ncbi:MAG: DUF2804 domain-containing protein [Desulfobacterales bacterium]|jgi:hypothetical protein|nr:DUF2804 domain-containing protein [Desulfobacterales bacterium]